MSKMRNSLNQGLRVCVLLAAQLCLLPALCYAADPVVRLDTTKGPIYIRVFRQMVPRTSANFLDLVSRGFYDGKIFHRIETWCIQGGDPNGNGTGVFVDPDSGGPRYIPLEINRNLSHNGPGVVAMARGNNRNSASCQFYITKSGMRQLDGNYAIFGRVVNGMNAVYAIRRGDRISSAEIAEQPAPSSPRQSGGGVNPNRTQGRSSYREPPPYEPPSETELENNDSGF